MIGISYDSPRPVFKAGLEAVLTARGLTPLERDDDGCLVPVFFNGTEYRLAIRREGADVRLRLLSRVSFPHNRIHHMAAGIAAGMGAEMGRYRFGVLHELRATRYTVDGTVPIARFTPEAFDAEVAEMIAWIFGLDSAIARYA